jgi:hypothetical protein
MKRIIFSVFVSMIAAAASAQSWTHGPDRATAPPSISGTPTGSPNVGGFEITCHQGIWSLYLFTGIAPDRSVSPPPATLIVDGQRFETNFDLRPPSADEGLVITPSIIEALRSGNQVEITFPTGGTPYSATFGLRGSSRALGAVEAECAYPTPTSSPNRFQLAPTQSTSEAITLASSILRPLLEEAHQVDGGVGIDMASIVDLDNGTRVLVSIIGPSTALYGVVAYSTVIAVQPPSRSWNVVAAENGFAVYVDRQSITDGYPDLVYQNQRGVNQPFVVWRWNGSEYVFSRRIDG